MGTEYFLCFIFDKSPKDIERFVSSNFKVRLRKPDESDRKFMEFERVEFLKKGLWKYPVVLVKKGGLWPNDPLKTADPHFMPIEYFNLRLFEVGGYSLLELNPHSRKSWTFVKSSELLEFLKPFLKWGVLLVAGYNDSIGLTEIGLEEDDENLLFMELVGIAKEGIARKVPSALTIVRKGYVKLNEGLYEIPIPWCSNKSGFLFITELMDYTVLWFLGSVDFNDPEDVYESLYEPWQLANDITIPAMLPLEAIRKVKGEGLERFVKRVFNAHVSGDCIFSPCGEILQD